MREKQNCLCLKTRFWVKLCASLCSLNVVLVESSVLREWFATSGNGFRRGAAAPTSFVPFPSEKPFCKQGWPPGAVCRMCPAFALCCLALCEKHFNRKIKGLNSEAAVRKFPPLIFTALSSDLGSISGSSAAMQQGDGWKEKCQGCLLHLDMFHVKGMNFHCSSMVTWRCSGGLSSLLV